MEVAEHVVSSGKMSDSATGSLNLNTRAEVGANACVLPMTDSEKICVRKKTGPVATSSKNGASDELLNRLQRQSRKSRGGTGLQIESAEFETIADT